MDLIDLSFFLYEAPIRLAIDAIWSGRLLEGDLNADGVVDAGDAETFASLYGLAGDGLAADANGDGFVDAADYTVWRDVGQASTVSIPEPTAAGLVTLALLAALRKQRF